MSSYKNTSVLKPDFYIIKILKNIVRYCRKCKIKFLNLNKKVFLAKEFYIGAGYQIYVPEYFYVSDYVAIAGNFLLQTNTTIGPHCLISSNVSFIGHDHDVKNSKSAFLSGRNTPSTITLKGNNFIGFGATILGNVTIGEGAIVGAQSLVLKDVEPNTIVAGIPAKIIGYRTVDENLNLRT